MSEHKLSKKITLYIWLAGIFLTSAITAEIIGVKIFTFQKLLGLETIFGLNLPLPAGFILWPIVFLTTDIINEYYGKDGVRKISILTASMIAFTFIFLFIATLLPSSTGWVDSYANPSDGTTPIDISRAFNLVAVQSIGIIIASLIAFLIGQLLDATLFQWIKRLTGDKHIWLRATGSTFISQIFDSYIVLLIAFYFIPMMQGTLKFSLGQVLGMSTTGYIYKVGMAILLTPFIYLAHYIIDRYLGEELATKMVHEDIKD